MELARIGEAVGSDVPFCVLGGAALAEGRGELLTPLPPLPPCHIVICKPPFPISTPQLFSRVNVRKIVRRPDTAGVADALAAGKLAALGVDVAEAEPLPADSPLLGAKNCIITPHISWAALETRQRLLDMAVENLRAFSAGKPDHVVNEI